MYFSMRQFLSHLELPSGCDNTQVLLGEVVTARRLADQNNRIQDPFGSGNAAAESI